jgi:signal transduction histidine kinase
LSGDRSSIVDALRSGWAYSIQLMALTMLMPVLGIFSRAQETLPDSTWRVWLVASVIPGTVGLGAFAIAAKLFRRMFSRWPALGALVLWSGTGVLIALSSAVIREWIPGATTAIPLNSALLVVVTVGTMGLLTLGRDRLDRYGNQLRQAQGQELRLARALEEQRQTGIEQLQELARQVDTTIGPEISRLEQEVARLGEDIATWQARDLGDEINRFTETMVRQVGHEFAEGTFREPAVVDPNVRTNAMRWRGRGGIWDLILSAHLTIGIVVIGAVYLFGRYARTGCVDSVSFAVAGYAVIGLLVSWVSTIPRLRQRPWALVLLIGGTTSGFVAMQYLLALDPGCVPEYPFASQVIDFVVSLSVLIALIVLFEAGRRARSDAEQLVRTNEELAEATLQIQRSQAVTRSRMAQILHGGVQGQLSSMSLALRRFVDSEAAGEQPSLVELQHRLDHQLAQVREEVNQLTSTNMFPPVNLESVIRKLILQWRGLLTIEYTIDANAASALAADDYIAWASSEVIDAAITNANAHGSAKFVWISIAVDPGPEALVITIDDDGSGPPDQVKPGMGLDGIVALGGQWQMTRGSGGGCSLRVTFPIT